MKRLNKENAINFLEKYFSLFLYNYRNAGYKIKIILTDNAEFHADYFYVQFHKGKEHTRNFKIVYQ